MTADPIFPGKILATFFGHHCRFYSFHSFTRVSPIISGIMQKNAASLVGTPFCGARVRPNMLNMPKSAAEYSVRKCVENRNDTMGQCVMGKLRHQMRMDHHVLWPMIHFTAGSMA